MVSFEKLTPADAPLLAKIGGITVLKSPGQSPPAEVMKAYVDRSFSEEACRAELNDEKNIFFAVYYNGQPAGYSKIIFDTPHPVVQLQPVTKLERLYLLEEYFGLGLGHSLLQQAIELSKKQDDKGMWLD